MNWLFKEEPTHYGFEQLRKDGSTVWSGVKNALAQKHLHAVRKGDRVFYYHTGDEKAIVGVAKASTDSYPDPEDASRAVVEIRPVKRLATPVPLSAIKQTRRFASLPLVRMPRLSVMPVSDDDWDAIEKMAG
jgi:predicted RNA-binding protein with PUA-like domain